MPFVHGKKAHFKLDNSAGTLVDLTGKFNQVSLPESLENAETTTFGVNDKTRIAGIGDATISLSGMWDTVLDAHVTALMNALKTGTLATASYEYGPEGTTTGNRKLSGESLVASYEIDEPVDGPVTFTLELETSAGVTHGVW